MGYRVAVVGAAGYAGIELVRLLLAHPDFELVAATSAEDAGKAISDVYPALAGTTDLFFTPHNDPVLATCDAVFLAVPHTAALKIAPSLLDSGVAVIDLSADFRLADVAIYESWYGVEHTAPELLATRAFGLPELFAEDLLRAKDQHASGTAPLVACAGCFPTATSLAAAPAIRLGWAREGAPIVVDAISGVTGAGKTPTARTHFCSVAENVEAYSVCRHRHTPEIEQILGLEGRVVFTPHLAPLKRGLLSTVTIPLTEDAQSLDDDAVIDAYRAAYEGRPLVDVLDAGRTPRTDSVAGTCLCQVGLAIDRRTGVLVAIGAIDNLCKGAAGQAVQCANIVFGLDERRGLPLSALPV